MTENIRAEDIVLVDENNLDTIHLDGDSGRLYLQNKEGETTACLDGKASSFHFAGNLFVNNHSGKHAFQMDGSRGLLGLSDLDGNIQVVLSGKAANLKLGGTKANSRPGADGDILLFSKDGDRSKDTNATVHLDADESAVHLRDGEGNTTVYLWGKYGNLRMGGQKANGESGVDGDILLFSKDSDRSKDANATIHFDADAKAILLKGEKNSTVTSIYLYTNTNKQPGAPYYRQANLKMGGQEYDSHIFLFNRDGDRSDTSAATIQLNGTEGNVLLGGRTDGQKGVDGDIWLFAKDGDQSKIETSTIHLDGDTGFIRCKGNIDAKDLCCRGADYAEEFSVSTSQIIESGTVMVINEAGELQPATTAYDKKVAGVVSGGGDLKPGVVLDRQPEESDRIPIALMGKVYCKVDAQYGVIEVGDLLTTSPTAGYAMKATDPSQTLGAVIGKALQPLQESRGMIPILVSLQ